MVADGGDGPPRPQGATVAICGACGNDCPEVAAFCGARGHRLGVTPAEPVTLTVPVVDPQPGGCLCGCCSLFAVAIAIVVIIALVTWLFSC
jgi:hypothetical protein